MRKLNGNHSGITNGRVKRTDRNKKQSWLIFAIIFIFIAVSGAYGLYEWYKYLQHKEYIAYVRQIVEVDTFYEGISVDEAALGGKTLDEAKSALLEMSKERLSSIKFQLRYGNDEWVIDYEDIDASLNVDEVIQQAFEVAREGDLLERYQQIMDLKENNLSFYTRLEYDEGLLADRIEHIAKQTDILPKDATIEFFPDNEEKFVITPEEPGLKLKQQELVKYLIHRIETSDFGEVTLELEDVTPAVFENDLKKLTSKVVQFYTGFGTSSENRIHNVRFSMSKINGLRLDPGAVFSFNETVGRRVIERGFRPAPIIMPDRSMQDSPGGGVCQASTMMYNAALRANLEIIERRHHSFPVFYVPAGLDAAVVYGAVDVKFMNNRETPVFFRTFYEDRKIFVEVYGEAFPNNGEIKVESRITETIAAPEPKRIRDDAKEHVKNPGEEKVHVENRMGIRVQSVMTYYENGTKVWYEVISNDFYRPIQGIIYYLPPLPAPTEPASPTQPPAGENSGQIGGDGGNTG
jgi:vancomycin resistance protein YoaR